MHELAVQWPSAPLPGAAKLGAWFQTGQSADPLATSTSSPNVGFYVFLDQALFREPGSRGGANEPPQGLSSFARVAFGPPDRNWVSFYADGGLTYTGLIPTRDADQLGVAFACAQVSSGARSHIASTGLTPAPAEMAAEFTYAIQVNPWLAIQPDLQFIIWPGASRSIPNALVIGCRTTLTF